MNIIILGGFLGSGKTTVLLSLADYIIRFNKDKCCAIPVAIIENEIGDVSIDNQIIEASNYNVQTIFSGCICCTLVSDLTACINDISQKINPAYAIIEATGLAYPGKIAETIRMYGNEFEDVKIFTVIDAERWDENMEILDIMMKKQIHCADIMLLNKIDTISIRKQKSIFNEVSRINSKGKLIPICAKNGLDDEIWENVFIDGGGA